MQIIWPVTEPPMTVNEIALVNSQKQKILRINVPVLK